MNFIQNVKHTIREKLEQTHSGYRLFLQREYGRVGPDGFPNAPWYNAVLKNREEVDEAVEQVRRIGLPVMTDLPKNWDSLAALDLILKNTDQDSRIFDAGGELYSMILPWLFLYGYRNLIAGNLVFKQKIKKGSILYQYEDITRTSFADENFDVVTCLSVLEHGVDLPSYFEEMARILKPGGFLVSSVDYFEEPIDTKNLVAYNVPIKIFCREEIEAALTLAENVGFVPLGPIKLHSEEKPVRWGRFDLEYTFAIFSFQKKG